MAGDAKRVDLCIGDFAVSIQGYDQPTAVLEEVLRLAARAQSETPEILNSGANFSEAAIIDLIGRVAEREGVDPDSLGAVPGLVFVHRMSETESLRTPAPERRSILRDPLHVADEDEAGTAEREEAAPASALTEDRFAEIAQRLAARDEELPAEAGMEGKDEPGDADLREAEADLPEEDVTPVDAELREPAEEEAAADAINIFFDDEEEEPQGAEVVNIFGDAETADAEAESAEQGGRRRRRALFGARAAQAAAPVAAEPEVSEAAAEGQFGTRFSSLLARVHGNAGPVRASDDAERSGGAEVARAAPAGGKTAGDIAASVGAETAAEHLLSAAAWLALVGRRPRFTRREIIAVFEEMPGDFDRSLEAKIKGVGKLVRGGQFVRLDDEHYGLSPEMMAQFRQVVRG